MAKPFIDFAALKAALTMEQVLEHYQLRPLLRPIRDGNGLEGACPIHQGTNKTQFKVSLSKNCWNCFSECKGGNALDFIAKMEKIDVYSAALKADGWFHLGLVTTKRRSESTPTSQTADQQFLEVKVASASRPPVPPPNSGGITKLSEVPPDEGHAEIGCNKPLTFELQNLDRNHGYFAERGLLPETVAAFGLGYCSKGTMAGRIAIPIHNMLGELVGYAGRWPGDPLEDRPMYKLPKGFHKSAEVFNLHRAMQESEEQALIIVEDFFDVLKLWQAGHRRSVALMDSSLSEIQEELLRMACNRHAHLELLLAENDAGRNGRAQALPRLAAFAYVRSVSLPRDGVASDRLDAALLAALLP